jgi:hypothetical protein
VTRLRQLTSLLLGLPQSAAAEAHDVSDWLRRPPLLLLAAPVSQWSIWEQQPPLLSPWKVTGKSM